MDRENAKGEYEIELVDSIEDVKEKIKICLLNKDNKLEIIDVNKAIINEKGINDDITLLIKLYDEYRNSLPLDYKTTLFENINVKAIKREKDGLYLEIEKIGAKTDVESFLTSLMWSYKYLGIKQMRVKIGKKVYQLDENIKINPIIFSTNLSHKFVYYEFTENGIIPYTIYHNESDLEVLLDMFSVNNNIVSDNKFKYSLDRNNNLEVYIEEKIHSVKLEEIKYNLEFLNYNSVKIFINGKLGYSASIN